MRRSVKGLVAGVATALAGAVFGLTPAGVGFEQGVGLAWLFTIRGPLAPPPDMVVVAIDDRTGGHLGLSALPREWPRSIHARLIERLLERGASVIVFDLDFSRPKAPEHDLSFADAVAAADRVVLVEKLSGKRQAVADRNGRHQGFVWMEHVIPPMPHLAEAAKGLGPFPVPKMEVAVHEFWAFKPSLGDAPTMPAVAVQIRALDAYARWLGLLGEAGVPGVDDLPRDAGELARAPEVRQLMRKLRRAFQEDPTLGVKLEQALDRVQDVSPRERRLVRALASLYQGGDHRYLNFYGPPGSITTIPYHAIVKGADPNIDTEALDLDGKIVFVGFSDLYDPGQPDRFYTVVTSPDGVDLSGVEIAATAFGNLLSDRCLRPTGPLMTASILVVFGGVMGAAVYLLPAITGVPLSLVLAALYATAVQLGFNMADLWAPLAIPLLVQLPLALFIGLLGQYLLERRQKQHATRAISYYLPEQLVRDLTEKSLDPSAMNKVAYSICFASDMAGFTTIAETMNPKDLALFLNDYFATLAEPLKRHKVDVTEFRADGVMCAWLAAQAEASVHRKAILAALEAVEAVARFKERHALRWYPLRIGLEAGTVYVGHAGGGGHFVYSIVGDCANTAARVEGLNKHLGTRLLATQAVVDGFDKLLLRPLGEFCFVGKSEPLPIVEILALNGAASEAQILLCERFAEALNLLRTGQWAKAADCFDAVLQDYPNDGPARFHLARCRRHLQASPPPEAPLIIRMDSK
jgi:adenylate cyclase